MLTKLTHPSRMFHQLLLLECSMMFQHLLAMEHSGILPEKESLRAYPDITLLLRHIALNVLSFCPVIELS